MFIVRLDEVTWYADIFRIWGCCICINNATSGLRDCGRCSVANVIYPGTIRAEMGTESLARMDPALACPSSSQDPRWPPAESEQFRQQVTVFCPGIELPTAKPMSTFPSCRASSLPVRGRLAGGGCSTRFGDESCAQEEPSVLLELLPSCLHYVCWCHPCPRALAF